MNGWTLLTSWRKLTSIRRRFTAAVVMWCRLWSRDDSPTEVEPTVEKSTRTFSPLEEPPAEPTEHQHQLGCRWTDEKTWQLKRLTSKRSILLFLYKQEHRRLQMVLHTREGYSICRQTGSDSVRIRKWQRKITLWHSRKLFNWIHLMNIPEVACRYCYK